MGFWLTCNKCGKKHTFALNKTVCECGGTMMVEYDLEKASQTLTKESLLHRPSSIWRYKELLPVKEEENIVSLGEGWTPLIRLSQQEAKLPLKKLWVKREEQNPTGSFKSRGFSVAISIAKEYGIKNVAVNSNGNAASALAAYASYADMESFVFVPLDCPGLIVEESVGYGANTYLVDGLIHDAGRIVKEGENDNRWHNVGTLKEPGRAEGKKTMGLELAEQLNWKLPDVIIYPTGGGSGIIGMWNAFKQLKQLGLIQGKLPRMVSVQEEGCQPLADAIDSDGIFKPQNENVTSNPTGMRVPNPPDGQLIISILNESSGTAVAVSKEEIEQARIAFGSQGISSSPEGSATWAGLIKLLDQGWIQKEDEVVLFNTAHAMKYLPYSQINLPVIKTYKDWMNLYFRKNQKEIQMT